ncbi:2-oxoglutarate dehydrogenase E1 component [Nannocystis sp.]|uniref:2-oxoglutarate dehydrogenase E1 component n=1 Tax=Nannocystis sp. TaxID=1962667 RepID=UPI0025F77630|nr:2-oxoglutarate dehydrogenase E1 component [Nannocystis sp.]MBK7827300.1 2-oxoglutarate dehydrogenase E1 component [Nannocystis sp.]
MDIESTLSGHNLAFLEALYEAYQRDPNSVDPEWVPVLRDLGRRTEPTTEPTTEPPGEPRRDAQEVEQFTLQSRVNKLIESYRLHGHMAATVDPLGRPRKATTPALDPAYFGLTEEHMDRSFDPGLLMPGGNATLRQIWSRLQNTYCRNVGVEYWHIPDLEQRTWLQARMEACENRQIPPIAEQKRLLNQMAGIESVDKFLHSKFIGAKRFSISGAEAMIAQLDCMIEEGAELGVREIILGMAHRGRLNVLMNILGKSVADVFSEFEKGDPWESIGSGDVKYHMGYFREYTTEKGHAMYLALAFNPSHLEAIAPVIQGRVRGKQDAIGDLGGERVMGITIHGDAAFAGQGIVQETLNLARLRGYRVGGTIRLVINNQVGFTTDPQDARSTIYSSDAAHLLQVPVFHVNGDDVEAAAYVARLAMAFRQRFKSDVVVDLVCYRRFGHNEGDDPTFTQPLMYELIKSHPSVRTIYQRELIARGTVDEAEANALDERWTKQYDDALTQARSTTRKPRKAPMHGVWQTYRGGPDSDTPEVPTAVDQATFDHLAARLTRWPDDFNLHPKLQRLVADAKEMLSGTHPLNWQMGEMTAYASLLAAGINVRFSGQDSQRGTFSHRHAVYTDIKTGRAWSPLHELGEGQGKFEIYNSPLSEYAVLAFEFGYSLIAPGALVIWEAQFGDFVNGAQIIIDNFLVSGEDKWNRLNGLVLMLPHGFEGQGPEHSSARLERFLQLAAEDNIQVCNLTTPAQVFHALRRQVLRPWRKPLILMTPKSLLRSRPSFSPVADFVDGGFQRVIDDAAVADPSKVTRVMLSAGKVYYDLHDERERLAASNLAANKVALVRVEQLYPFPTPQLAATLARYPNASELLWVQEEPKNMGGWTFARPLIDELLVALPRFAAVRYVGRIASASPATGSPDSHALERKLILEEAFANLA